MIECLDCGYTWKNEAQRRFYVRHLAQCPGTRKFLICGLMAYVDAKMDAHNCWVPQENVTPLGYRGKYLVFNNRYASHVVGEMYVHRAAFKLWMGRAPREGLQVAHECGPDGYENGHCMAPMHLVERTPKENHAHMSPEVRARISSAGGLVSPTRFQPGHRTWNRGLTKNG